MHIEGLEQEITLRRNTRIKHLSIKISARSGIVVCVPYNMSDNTAMKFVVQKTEWIKEHISKIENRNSLDNFNELILTKGKIVFSEIEHNVINYTQKNSIIEVEIPKNWDFQKKRKYKRKIALAIIKNLASTFLPKRTELLAKQHGFKYNKITLRNQKTLWGSCSFHDNISLNVQLMRLPLHLIDYVILHELCHTIHKNHSTNFWKLMEMKMEVSLQKCKLELKEYDTHF